MLLSKIKVATAVVLMVAAVGVSGNRLFVPTRAGEGADRPRQAQPEKPQPAPHKGKLHIEAGISDTELVRHCMFVRDPSFGKYKVLTKDDGIPVLKAHIEFHVKKLKGAKDDQSIRAALRSLEESVRDLKDLLALPGAPAEKKPDKQKPTREQPPLDKIVDRLGLAGQLAKINAVDTRHLRELAIRIVRDGIELQVQRLKEAKDDKSIREALKGLEESVQNMKVLLSLPHVPAEKGPERQEAGERGGATS